jgi:Mg2+/Co2+ transporter CorC
MSMILPSRGDFRTVAGFALLTLGHLPQAGEHFDYEGWRLEIVDTWAGVASTRFSLFLQVPSRASRVTS